MTKTSVGRTVMISTRLRPVLEMVRTNPLPWKDHELLAYVFGNTAGEAVASPKRAWETLVQRGHGY